MLYPIAALAFFTFVFLYLSFFRRYNAVKKGSVSIKYFQRFDPGVSASPVPVHIELGRNHFTNLFETPVLFYTAGVLSIALGIDSSLLNLIAWLYVAARVVHCFIHCGTNNVIHRMLVFQFSIILLMAMWVLLLVLAP